MLKFLRIKKKIKYCSRYPSMNTNSLYLAYYAYPKAIKKYQANAADRTSFILGIYNIISIKN